MSNEEIKEMFVQQRAEEIQIRLPRSTLDIGSLFQLLSSATNQISGGDNYRLFGASQELRPLTRLMAVESLAPQITLQLPDNLHRSWTLGNLIIGFNLPDVADIKPTTAASQPVVEKKKDEAGEYCVIRRNSGTYYQLTFGQLLSRFNHHIREADHFGICLGSKLMTRTDYEDFRGSIGRVINLHRYPTGEEWPFVVPSTNTEFFNGITQTGRPRNPKFEIVYHPYHVLPEIQLDLNTNLSREEIENLLPKPYGVSFPELADIFRTVYIYTGWNGVIFRVDLGFKSNNRGSGLTDWLIKEGSRIS